MKKLVCMLLFLPWAGWAQTQTENYIVKKVYKTKRTDAQTLHNVPQDSVLTSITYFDGLGRAKQGINLQGGGNRQDIVTHIEYDPLGRQTKDFLPFAYSNITGAIYNYALSATKTFYKDAYPDDFVDIHPKEINPYSEKEFEASPLNRVLKQAAPGHDWRLGGGHEIAFEYETNTTGEVKLYQVTTSFANNTYTPTLIGGSDDYFSGELYKTITKDENHDGSTKNHTTEEFKNKQGQVVLKRTYNNNIAHDTYYVYDDYGNLTYVLPPEANDHSMDTTVLDAWCYQYTYDYRNRLVAKKIPGKGWESIVYNKMNQPICTQDANLEENDKWLFTKYDILGRVVYTGMMNSTADRETLQENADDDSTYQKVESRTTQSTIAGTSIYYTNQAFPTSGIDEIYTINYYDDYVDEPSGFIAPTEVYNQSVTTNSKGLATGSKVKVLETNHWITTIRYYDEKARPVYVYSKNEYLGTTDIIESQLDFTGKVLQTKRTHKKTGTADIVSEDSFTYDHAERLLTQKQSLNGGAQEVILENTYDELGQLATKKVGGKTSQSRLQEIDYAYNVRGWLKNINQDAKSDNDLFNFSLQYNDIAESDKKLYNGNISGASWTTASMHTNNNPVSNQYTYAYDALNRITEAIDNTGNYNLNNVSYDKNGNITNLSRNGHTNVGATSFGLMDDLTYRYDSGNQLTKVADAAPIDQFGFKDDAVNTAADTTNDYTYDDNGNMKTDTNKDITGISYNHLNLPTKVTINNGNIWSGGGQISYVYDATGVKLSKTVSGAYSTVATKYAGNYVYEDRTTIIYGGSTFTSELQFFNHPEGYVQHKNGIFSYVYQYKDHLGNVRLSYADINGNYQTILDDDFSDSLGGWLENGTVNYSLDAGRLKANVKTSYEGVKHYLNGFTTTAGEVLKVKITFDKGNTQSNVRLYLHEVDPSGNLVAYNVKTGNLQTGTYEYSHTMANTGNSIIFRIDKDNTNTSTETYFYIDHVSLTQNDLEIIEESNYYPFGLEHKGYNNVTSSNGNSTAQKFGYNGKEHEEELGKDTYAYGWRDYDPAIGRFNKVDRFAEKYYSLSTYSYAGNNPIFFVDVQGDSIASGASTRRANRIERRAERRANRLDRQADRREARGQDVADLRERSSELRQSAQDVRDMRADQNNMFRFASVNGREAKRAGIVGPSTAATGTTESGLNEITLYTEGNMGSQLHETRHGGQHSRGEINAVTQTSSINAEVSAYRAQYSWNGSLSARTLNGNTVNIQDIQGLSNTITGRLNRGLLDLGNYPTGVQTTNITNINQITRGFVNNLVEVGNGGVQGGPNYLLWIYALLR